MPNSNMESVEENLSNSKPLDNLEVLYRRADVSNNGNDDPIGLGEFIAALERREERIKVETLQRLGASIELLPATEEVQTILGYVNQFITEIEQLETLDGQENTDV